jgi:biotin operon repressor
MSELKTSNERELDTETMHWLSYAGSDERKLLILLTLAQLDEPIGTQQLISEMEVLAGESLPGKWSNVNNFLNKSLARTSSVEVVEMEMQRRIGATTSTYTSLVSGYQITGSGLEKIEYAGSLLDWSFRHADFTLGSMLGQPDSKGNAPTAFNRYSLLKSLLEEPSLSAAELAERLNLPEKMLVKSVISLRNHGIVSDDKGYKSLHLSPTASSAVGEIIDLINGQGVDDNAPGMEFAERVLHGPELFRILYGKPYDYSNNANIDPEIDRRVFKIIQNLGKRSVRDIHLTYVQETERRVDFNVVYSSLSRLVTQGLIEYQKELVPGTNPPKFTNIYRPKAR